MILLHPILQSFAVSLGIIQALNLADVPCGNMASGNRGLHQRIVGGAVTDITNFPHAISLKKNGQHWCGGSLVRLGLTFRINLKGIYCSSQFKTGSY